MTTRIVLDKRPYFVLSSYLSNCVTISVSIVIDMTRKVAEQAINPEDDNLTEVHFLSDYTVGLYPICK